MKYENIPKNYKEIGKLYNDFSLNDLSLMALFIFRPIEFKITNSVIFDIVLSDLNYYNYLIIIYLLLNLAVDSIIFIIIQKFVIQRILLINDELNSLLDMLKIY
jgi:hypothetical protein